MTTLRGRPDSRRFLNLWDESPARSHFGTKRGLVVPRPSAQDPRGSAEKITAITQYTPLLEGRIKAR